MKPAEGKDKADAKAVLKQAIRNVCPILEVKGRRIGGANYQVPNGSSRATQDLFGYEVDSLTPPF